MRRKRTSSAKNSGMKTEYDFSKAMRGKFYHSDQDLNLPREEDNAHEWDNQIERDAKSGKLDKMAEQAIADFRAGSFLEL